MEIRRVGGLNPRFDDIMQKYIDYFDESANPRMNPAKLGSRLNKRDHMHFDASNATVAELSQMTCGAVMWTCTASVVRADVDMFVAKLRLSDLPWALRVPEATPASNNEEKRRELRQCVSSSLPTRTSSRRLSLSSTAYESKTNHEFEAKVEESEQVDSPGGDSDDDLRPIIKGMVPQAVVVSEDGSPPGRGELATSDIGTQGF